MSFDLHTVDVKLGSTGLAMQDRLMVGMLTGVANVAGSGAGASVVTAVAFSGKLPATYNVQVNPNQDAVAYVSGKTTSGFNVTLNPRLATNTLAAGTFDVMVFA
jgi:hypothetical protein